MQLLVALKSFVCSLGYQSQACYDMLLPILQNGINVDSPDSLNLLEDAIQVRILLGNQIIRKRTMMILLCSFN
jgi:hypothetical protein